MEAHGGVTQGGQAQSPVITDHEFMLFKRFIHEAAGISMTPAKKSLVCARLGKRLEKYQMRSYHQYYNLVTGGGAPAEAQIAIDLLTTNETYFFREPSHFTLLRNLALEARGRATPFRVWSAACSSGEEAYSIAMVLADCLEGVPWEVIGSDISSRVLEKARAGHYAMARVDNIPVDYLRRFCLKGIGSEQGTLLIDSTLRGRVQFRQICLNSPLPDLGMFDMVFLRNVMIYFNDDTKRDVTARVLSLLRPGGHFCIGHSESLNGINNTVQALAPSVYRKPHA